MVTRLTHGKKPDLVDTIFQALGRSFSLTGVAASLRAARKMVVPDKIPYLLRGYPASLSKPAPVWSSVPTFSFSESSQPVTYPLGVSAGGAVITMSWVSTPMTGVTFTNGVSPSITFTSATTQTTSITLRATANGQTADSTGTITVSAAGNSAPVWNSPASTTFTLYQSGTLNLNDATRFTDPNGDSMTFSIVSGPSLTGTGVSFNTATGVFTAASNATIQTLGPFVVRADDGVSDVVDVTTLQLVSTAGGSNLPWTAGQTFKEGDIPSGQNITSDQAEFDAAVLNRWPDNSVKFAVLSGRAANTPVTITLRRTPSAVSGVDITTANLQTAMGANTAVIGFGASSATWSGADWLSPFRQITAGKQMSSWTYRKPLGSDAHLVAWLEVRCYKGGAVEILPWVENGYLTVAGPTSKAGRATFTLGGTLRYDSINDASVGYVDASGIVTIYHHSRAVLIRNQQWSYWLGTANPVRPIHNRTYLRDAKFVPAYYAITPDPSVLSSLTAHYSPGRICNLTGGMGGPGFKPDIGMLPNTSALYLITGDSRAYSAVLSDGFALSSYSIHYRDEATNRPLLFTSHPNRSMATGTGLPTPAGGNPGAIYASSHHPAAAYLPYLLTGWHWFLEEMQFQTTDHYLTRNEAYRQGANFYLYPNANGWDHNENGGLRGIAWPLRTLAMTAAFTPDADATMRGQFVTVLNYNATQWRTEMTTGPNANVLGYFGTGPLLAEPIQGTWMHGFFAGSMGLAWDLEVATGTGRDNLLWMRDFNYSMFVGLLGRSGVSTEFSFTRAANYGELSLADSNGTPLTNWGAVWTASYGSPNTDASANTLTGGNIGAGDGLATSYWGNIQPGVAYAVDHGAPGALAGYNRMINSTNWAGRLPEFNLVQTWAVKPRTV